MESFVLFLIFCFIVMMIAESRERERLAERYQRNRPLSDAEIARNKRENAKPWVAPKK